VRPTGVIDLSTHKNNIRIKPAPTLASASSGLEEEKNKAEALLALKNKELEVVMEKVRALN
jgi:hypothetical protein